MSVMRRLALRSVPFVITAIAFIAALWLVSWLVRQNLNATQSTWSDAEVAEVLAARDVSFTPKDWYALHRDVKIEPSGQSPILAKLVKAGELPPLDERLPEEPVVMAGVDGIGKYGGTWLRAAISEGDMDVIANRLSGAYLVRWSPLGYPIKPHVAKAVEPSEDYKTWTVKLRKGLRWSDGQPYTADDIMYWWNAEVNHPMLRETPPWFMRVEDTYGRVERVGPYEVRFVFDKPYPLFLEMLARESGPCNTPAHYLKPYHPDPEIGDPKKIEQAMRTYQMPSPRSLYAELKGSRNPEYPRLWPWVYRTYRSSPPQTFVRNPYYFVVDTQGNQLPYLDQVQFELQDGSMLALSAANGKVSMQTRHIRFEDYTELMSRRDEADTRILHWYPATRSVYVINPNLNRRVDPQSPVSKWKSQLLKDKRFRQALSLAIDREEIIQADYYGVGEPAQVAPGPESRFHHEALLEAFTAYDPQRANQLLDDLGLAQRDGEGYRTFPDGSRMTWFLDYTQFTGEGPAQFIVDHWAKVGIRLIARQRSRSLFYTEKAARTFDFNVWTGESDLMPLVFPRYYIAMNVESNYAIGWGAWYEQGGFFGVELDGQGVVPVPEDSPMYEAMTHYAQARRAADFQEQKRHMDRVLDIAAENVWSISIATAPPQPVVVKKDFRNVPPVALYGVIYSTPANAGIETYYMEASNNSPGAVAEIEQAIVESTPMYATARTTAGWLAGWLRSMLLLAVVLLVVLAAVRHPFIGRRLLILMPTLLVISIVVFIIIQAPPGDYLSTQIMELQESGDQADMQRIEDLKELFHYDDPMWQQYLRWMGVPWFWTFNSADMGLLQGDLGRSMQSTQPVNQMVGERVMLTLAISVGTILLTWLIAIPIGIYSAVRQYSPTDYALTLLGFVGMCVPPFLLALVLMAISGVSGLFSPEFAAQPEWDWPKLVDLLQHIWIPILVLGVSGTAGMIRVMRANLLDELKKPYVTTAMAKGMRPGRLLMKYPVRMALNPFISGIGSLFPQLISGGAIVAMVLALPTVGPLLLSALFSQDMYLAGSLLMVLSLLGVLGTLVSDLLLLWLDPRIRFEGGTR